MTDRAPCQEQFDALPKWAQNIILGLSGMGSYGASGSLDGTAKYQTAFFHLSNDKAELFWQGVEEMLELVHAMSAP